MVIQNTSNNDTVQNEIKEMRYITVLNYLLYVIGVLITLATIIGNVFVIVAVISEKRLRKVGNVFIINLAISDCLVGLIVSPLAITYDITEQWALGEVVCDIWVSLDIVCCSASILNLCAIAYDRSNAIVKPMKYARKRTFKRAWCVVIFVWVYSVLIAVPRFLGWRKKGETGLPDGKCVISQDIGYTFYSILMAFVLPMVVMLYFYYKIYSATCVRSSQWHQRPGNNHFKDTQVKGEDRRVCLSCFTCAWPKFLIEDKCEFPDTQEQSTQTVQETPSDKLIPQLSVPEDEMRRESIEPELLAIYQMRQRSKRILSNATMTSVGSAFYSSSDSSQTATTSFSDTSDRSSSISTEGRDRSYSSSTEGSRSFSSESRRHSNLRGHRLSSARHSSLHQEVIHEIASAAQLELQDESEQPTGAAKLKMMRQTGTVETDDTHDELSDDGQGTKQRVKRKLKSSTLRRHNSRKSKKIAISQEKRAAKTLGIVMGCFSVCWLPFFLITFLRVVCYDCAIPSILIKSVMWLGYFNSACNPFIYTFFNKDFRMAFRKLSCKASGNVVYL
ncbi:5-hydroxytryptamine receptor 1F-like [Mya arenaria]|uniref:5-hydroxytryptamine receptor 1F-like n=1 Tax=Mya arenaria TaxID=6604 RepID=UPI0022E2600F|nr:5-hydroxytryptamine receptor 1F-like [Mya arenaria]